MMRSANTASTSEMASPDAGDQHREHRRDLERVEIELVVEELAEIVEPDELQVAAERVLDVQRLVDRLPGRQEEEDQRDRDLRRDQRVRQPPGLEPRALFHRHRSFVSASA